MAYKLLMAKNYELKEEQKRIDFIYFSKLM